MTPIAPYAALAALLFAMPAQAQKSFNAQARTAGELAELCAASPKDPLGDAKINFCHGYAQGAIATEQRHADGKKVCFPSGTTRTTTMNEFVAWVKANSDQKGANVLDGLFRFLGEKYPCR